MTTQYKITTQYNIRKSYLDISLRQEEVQAGGVAGGDCGCGEMEGKVATLSLRHRGVDVKGGVAGVEDDTEKVRAAGLRSGVEGCMAGDEVDSV